jgi:hypothetical protein
MTPERYLKQLAHPTTAPNVFAKHNQHPLSPAGRGLG